MLIGNREAVPLVLLVVISINHDVDERKAVEHNYVEGETNFISICDKIVLI